MYILFFKCYIIFQKFNLDLPRQVFEGWQGRRCVPTFDGFGAAR